MNGVAVGVGHRLRPIEDVARRLNLTADELLETAARAKPILYRARQERIPPGLDDKVITSWNGMMLSAMAEAARVFGEDRYLEQAQRTADFLLTVHAQPDGRLLRTSRAGHAHLNAYLEDYAYLAEGLLDVYEAGADERYLRAAEQLAGFLITDFLDREQGGFFTTAEHHESLILRAREGTDGAVPHGDARLDPIKASARMTKPGAPFARWISSGRGASSARRATSRAASGPVRSSV